MTRAIDTDGEPAAPATDEAWGERRSRLVTWHDPAAAAALAAPLSGREFVQALADGRIAPPPMAELVGIRLLAVHDGEVVLACTPDESFYNPLGVVHGGLLCTVLDTAIGLAVSTTMPAGAGFTTIEIKVNFLRAVRAGDGELRARGTVTKRGRRVVFAAAEIADAAGEPVGSATSSLLVADAAR